MDCFSSLAGSVVELCSMATALTCILSMEENPGSCLFYLLIDFVDLVLGLWRGALLAAAGVAVTSMSSGVPL